MSENPQVDPYLSAALQEENSLLQQAVQQAQIQHLMNRAVHLNADLRRMQESDEPEVPESDEPGVPSADPQ